MVGLTFEVLCLWFTVFERLIERQTNYNLQDLRDRNIKCRLNIFRGG